MSDLAAITTEAVEASLKAVRTGQPPDSDMLTINWSASGIHEENILALEKLLQDLIWNAYFELRRAEELPPVRPQTRQELMNQIEEDFQIGNSNLEAWSALYFRYVNPLEVSVEELARAASVVQQQFRRRMQLGLALLVQQLRRKAARIEPASPSNQIDLPVPDFTRLVGHTAYMAHLRSLFEHETGPGIVSLEGMGGIGKSALARAFVAMPEVSYHWKNLFWVSARQSIVNDDGQVSTLLDAIATLEDISIRLCEQLRLSSLAAKALTERLVGLQEILSQEPHLIVIDNLETVEEYQRLVPALAKLAGKSRFLITSRQTLRDFPYVHTLAVKELNESEAHKLVQNEIERRGRSIPVSEASFHELYQVTGGLPLALKLVAAQLHLKPLHTVLDGFRTAKDGMDGLYHYLYWQTWNSLRDHSRRLLLTFLPTDPEGEDLEFIQVMSGISPEEFYPALKGLDQFSLLEINGDAEHPLYRLHRLTVTFLQTDILNLWSTGTVDYPK
jgi:hypothetical protein